MNNDTAANVRGKLPPIANKLLRYILGFGVSFAIGLAPFLGKLNVPLFTPLLYLIPLSIQNVAIPVSAAFMGLVAVVTQWYGGGTLSEKWLQKKFTLALIIAVCGLLALLIVYSLAVATVKVGTEKREVRFIVGFTRPEKAPCTGGMSAAKCVELLDTDTVAIESHWGDQQIALATLALILPYLGFMSAFGMMIGLLVLKQRMIELRESPPSAQPQ